MSKKIDLSKILTKGSAKQRAALLIYHYTILEAIDLGNKEVKPILTEAEAKAIFDSFKEPRERKAYNDYRELNKNFITAIRQLIVRSLSFERDYYKYLYHKELFNKIDTKIEKKKIAFITENVLINSYSDFINFATALKVYAKEKGYTNKHMLDSIDIFLSNTKNIYYPYSIENGKELIFSLEDIEPDYEEVQKILLDEFNYNYEKEPE